MNTLSRLDDPLAAPAVDPQAVRRRAHSLRRRRTATRWGAAGGAATAVALLVVGLAGPRGVDVVTRPGGAAAAGAPCVPGVRVTRTFVVLAGANPDDNRTLVDALTEIVGTRDFAGELHGRLPQDLASRYSVEDVRSAIDVAHPPGASVIRIGVEAPSADDARRISAEATPSLSAVLQGGQRTLPIEERLPGPIAQEMPGEPTEERVTC